MQGSFGSCNWNEYNLNPLTRNNWRASLVPAAAVIPAPIAYIKVVAVKKLVVELQTWLGGPLNGVCCLAGSYLLVSRCALYWCAPGNQDLSLEKIRVFKAGLCLNTLAWDNKIGRAVLF